MNKLAIFVGVASLSYCLACSEPERKSPAKRVILITCDTLRADRLGFAGYDRPVSPNLDALAAESTVFTNAWSSAPLTVPALSALLTGRFPDEVGAGPTNLDVMPADVVTIAEVARDAGIATAAFVSNGVLQRPSKTADDFGVQQGFDHYDDAMNSKEANRPILERTADACTDAVVSWLGTKDAVGPFFLWVHYQDPHGPYTPPPAHLANFASPAIEERALPVGTGNTGHGQIPKYQRLPGIFAPQAYKDRYDAEIHFFDSQLGRLVDELRRRDMLEDSLLVFTADHGESLGEHDFWFCHGETLHEELVRVPFFVRYPKSLRESATKPQQGAARVDGIVGHVDVWPTIVEALGLEAPKNRGTSLLGPSVPKHRVMPQFLGPVRNPGRRLAVTDGRWRVLIVTSDPPRLFDLVADPGGTKDVASEHAPILEALEAQYTQFMRADPRPWARSFRPAMDAERLRGIHGLGYTDGDGH